MKVSPAARPVYAQMKGIYDEAIRYVSELEAVGCDEIMCTIQMGTIPQKVMLETIRQFGHHVIPHFRAKEPQSHVAV